MAKKVTGSGEAADSGRQGHAGAAGGHGARSAGRQHHGVLQGVQRQDLGQGSGRSDHPGGDHDLLGPLVHVHHQDAAGAGADQARRATWPRDRPSRTRTKVGKITAGAGGRDRQDQDAGSELLRRWKRRCSASRARRAAWASTSACSRQPAADAGHASCCARVQSVASNCGMRWTDGSARRQSGGGRRPAVCTNEDYGQKTRQEIQGCAAQVEKRPYTLDEAVPLVQKIKFAKFDETVELHMRLGVDPKHADQMVRGTVVLPNGLGKSKTVLVIASGDKQREAEAGRRGFRRRRRHGEEDPGRLDGFRRRHRHAGHDALGRAPGQGARPARPDAEPEDRHGHHGRRARR